MSCGPWDATGTNLTGLALTTTPTVYIVPIKSSARFKVDPGYASATGKGSITDFTKIAAIQFGYRRSGAVAGSGIMDAKFAIDDVIIMSKLPGVSGSAPAPFPESGATGSTFPVVLDAIPSHPVTFVPAVSNPSAFTISPASMTFTSANWDTTQTFSVQAVAANDDPIREPDTTGSVAYTVVTNDLAYMQITQAPLTVRIADDDPTATLGFAPATASALETDGALTVTVALSAPSLTTVTATLSADIPAGTATAGDDFDFTTASLVFAPGATTATTTINVLNDATNEQPETAVLTLTDLSGADSGATTYTLTITSDEVPVAVSRFGLD